jgi:hypothetical protein
MTLLDEFFPKYDVRECHSRQIAASPERVFTALRTANLAGSVTARVLFALRASQRSSRVRCTAESPCSAGACCGSRTSSARGSPS